MGEPTIDREFFPIFEGATELVARQLAFFREDDAEPTENEKLMAGHIVGNLVANGYTQLPGTVERLRAALEDARRDLFSISPKAGSRSPVRKVAEDAASRIEAALDHG